MVQDALANNHWLSDEGVQVIAQGSFTNRTNARLEADIDLRVQHPSLRIDYAPGVDVATAYHRGRYFDTGRSYAAISAAMRSVIVSDLTDAFGALNIDATGNKAIRVKGLTGSRSEVDVVAAFTLHHITGMALFDSLTHKGVAILSRDSNSWTFNYPDQHAENGKRKRLSTGLQFKRVVRIVKRLCSKKPGGGLIIFPDGLLINHREPIVELAARYRLPAVYPFRIFAEVGGLLYYGPNFKVIFRRTAEYVDKILRGARPADLPVEAPTELEFVINLKTALALGLTVSPRLQIAANELIQ
jgi:ABC transporter substrate binding protein